MVARHIPIWIFAFILVAGTGGARAAQGPRDGLGNPFFAFCMDTHDAAHRTLAQQAELLKELGYDGCGHLWLDGLEERIKTLDAAGLRLFQVYLNVNIAEGQEAYDARLKTMLPLLKGRDTMLALLVKGGKPSDPAGDDRAAALAGQIADLAAAQGVRVALYPHVGCWLQSVDDALRVIARARRPNLGLMFNLCHALKVEDPAAFPTLLAKARPHLFAVSINGGDGSAQIKAGTGKWVAPLGEGSYDVAALLRTLQGLGYTGPIGLQCYGIPGDARLHLTRSIEAWRALSRALYRDESGFHSLFNGRDLTGWAGESEWWSAQNGCLTARSTAGHPCKKQSYLMYRAAQPADFDLRLEWRLQGGNSGIQIRSRELPGWDTRGYQADMDDADAYTGSIYEHMRLEIALLGQQTTFAPDGKKTIAWFGKPAELKKIVRHRDWNEYRIVCYGNEITLYLNGIMTARTCDDQTGKAARRGTIALQNHPGPPMMVEFRNIRMKVFGAD